MIIALVRKLGGEVIITDKDLLEAEAMELQQNESPDFRRALHYRARMAPLTLEGETIAEPLGVKGCGA